MGEDLIDPLGFKAHMKTTTCHFDMSKTSPSSKLRKIKYCILLVMINFQKAKDECSGSFTKASM
jgi:hypothetical protein